ncbi:MAG: hypothetical protein P8Y45_14995 [Exilibacterium sp.]
MYFLLVAMLNELITIIGPTVGQEMSAIGKAAANNLNPIKKLKGSKHGDQRKQEGQQDANRNVGDSNKVAQNGRQFTDSNTGNTVHVSGNRVVITDSNGKLVTQFKNTKKNTQKRISSGRWVPK